MTRVHLDCNCLLNTFSTKFWFSPKMNLAFGRNFLKCGRMIQSVLTPITIFINKITFVRMLLNKAKMMWSANRSCWQSSGWSRGVPAVVDFYSFLSPCKPRLPTSPSIPVQGANFDGFVNRWVGLCDELFNWNDFFSSRITFLPKHIKGFEDLKQKNENFNLCIIFKGISNKT